MKKGFKLVSTFLVSFMIMMSSIMPAFADETDTIDIYDSALTLDGLRILYEKNCSGK